MSLMDFLGLDEPSEFHLLRNHLQKVTHPHLTIYGHGDYYIEYKERGRQIFQYFKFSNQYEEYLLQMRKDSSSEILKHGKLPYKAWQKWEK